MLTLPPTVRVFIAVQPADLRKGFDGLAAVTRSVIHEDPMSGHLFVFFNRRSDRSKVLYWDRSGWCVFYNQQSSHYTSFDRRHGRRRGVIRRDRPSPAVQPARIDDLTIGKREDRQPRGVTRGQRGASVLGRPAASAQTRSGQAGSRHRRSSDREPCHASGPRSRRGCWMGYREPVDEDVRQASDESARDRQDERSPRASQRADLRADPAG